MAVTIPRGLYLSGVLPSFDCELWWRADIKRYANYRPYDEFESEACGSHLRLEVTPYAVVRSTPKGVILKGWMSGEFFQLGNAIRQQAVPTIELALIDLKFRKTKHVRMALSRLNDAKDQLAMTERALTNHWG